jgi:hypothetical protein
MDICVWSVLSGSGYEYNGMFLVKNPSGMTESAEIKCEILFKKAPPGAKNSHII